MTITLPHGRVFVPSMLEEDVLRLLAPDTIVDGGQNWLMHLVADVEQQAGLDLGTLPEPKSWNKITAVDDWPLGRLPAVLIITGGSEGDPERQADGSYIEPVGLQIAVVDSARTFWEAHRNAGIYAASARAALVQHLLDLPDPAANVQGILAGRVDRRPMAVRDPDRADTVAAGLVACRVMIDNTLSDLVDLTEPYGDPGDPVPDLPTVDPDGISITVNT